MYFTQNCEQDHIGFVLLILLEWLPIGAIFIVVGPIYLFLLCCLWQQGKQYTPLVEVTRKTIYQQMLADVNYIKWFPLPLFIMNLLLIIARLIIGYLRHSDVTLWSLTFIVYGLQGGIITLVITLDPNTRKKLNWNSFKAAWYQNILRRSATEIYPIIRAEHGDSIQRAP